MIIRIFTTFLRWTAGIIVALVLAIFLLSLEFSPPATYQYGVSFSRFHADELGVDWKETFLAILNDLKVRNFRFSAHWPSIEPEQNKFNFQELDFQMDQARKAGASVILAVGRRLPGWPECHDPEWVKNLTIAERQERVLKQIETVVTRYKSYENILYWQVENEPFLTFFSQYHCGDFDRDFLLKEVALVRRLDPERKVLLTDSGELSTWYGAYKNGDVFGTSIYLYIWNRKLGPLKYPIGAWFFRAKHNLVRLLLGEKRAIVIELSAEPWLLQPIVETSLGIQFGRMDVAKFNEMLDFSKKTGFDSFYLWGAEWWYWLKLNGNPELWNRAQELFSPPALSD